MVKFRSAPAWILPQMWVTPYPSMPRCQRRNAPTILKNPQAKPDIIRQTAAGTGFGCRVKIFSNTDRFQGSTSETRYYFNIWILKWEYFNAGTTVVLASFIYHLRYFIRNRQGKFSAIRTIKSQEVWECLLTLSSKEWQFSPAVQDLNLEYAVSLCMCRLALPICTCTY